jgi:hypothetical protein
VQVFKLLKERPAGEALKGMKALIEALLLLAVPGET